PCGEAGVVANVDADGIGDLVLTCQGDAPSIVVWSGADAAAGRVVSIGSVPPALVHPYGADWLARAGDLDGDGLEEVALEPGRASFSGPSTAVVDPDTDWALIATGAGLASEADVQTQGWHLVSAGAWYPIPGSGGAVGDVDGDGIEDLIVAAEPSTT